MDIWKRLHQSESSLEFLKLEVTKMTKDGKEQSVLVDKKALVYYKWLDWIVYNYLPFSFVNSEKTRDYANIKPIDRHLVPKLMSKVCAAVEAKITSMLPLYVGLMFDGWDERSSHYLGILI